MSNTTRNSKYAGREDWAQKPTFKSHLKEAGFLARSASRELGGTALKGAVVLAAVGALAVAGHEVKTAHDHRQDVTELIQDALKNPTDAKGLNVYTAVEGDTVNSIADKLARPADENGENSGHDELKLDLSVQTNEAGGIAAGQQLLLERMALDPAALAVNGITVYSVSPQ